MSGLRRDLPDVKTEETDEILIKHGQRVMFTEVFTRAGRGKSVFWQSRSVDVAKGVYLGVRTLRDGIVEFDHEAGCAFKCKRAFRAALVSPGLQRNPIYVPMRALVI